MTTKNGLSQGSDGKLRCSWGTSQPDYELYHDNEWGRVTADDQRLFEKICLEGFQSGLSWLTILRKREAFRKAFRDFDFEKVARFNQSSVQRLLGDAGIVRHRGKIEATINNAQKCCDLMDEEGSLAAFVWGFEPKPSERPKKATWAALSKLAETPASRALSKELKARGWKFVGPTTMYAFLQSMGVVNDHVDGCIARSPCERERDGFDRPT